LRLRLSHITVSRMGCRPSGASVTGCWSISITTRYWSVSIVVTGSRSVSIATRYWSVSITVTRSWAVSIAVTGRWSVTIVVARRWAVAKASRRSWPVFITVARSWPVFIRQRWPGSVSKVGYSVSIAIVGPYVRGCSIDRHSGRHEYRPSSGTDDDSARRHISGLRRNSRNVQ
jgi:hypothetical protein